MTEISISQLKQHPAQKEIYGDEPVDMDLARSIKAKGILQPLIVNEKYQVLSGNRRWKAALKAGRKTVPVEIKSGLSATDQEALIIELNLQRKKTPRQIAREAMKLREIETARAKERQAATLFREQDSTVRANVAHTVKAEEEQKPKGRATEIVGAKLGMGRRTTEKLIEVEEKIEELEEKGDKEGAKKLEKTLNDKSINAAHAQVKPKPQSKPSQPRVPKFTDAFTDVLPDIDEGWIRGRQWELCTIIMRKLTGKDEAGARNLIGNLIIDTEQSAAFGALAVAGNNLNYIKSEKLNPLAYVTAIAKGIKQQRYNNGKSTNATRDRRADSEEADASARNALDAARAGSKTRTLGRRPD